MKTHEIEVGKTYQNKGKGTTRRRVLAMRDDLSCGGGKDVRYMQVGGPWDGSEAWLQLASFSSWAGSEVKEGECSIGVVTKTIIENGRASLRVGTFGMPEGHICASLIEPNAVKLACFGATVEEALANLEEELQRKARDGK